MWRHYLPRLIDYAFRHLADRDTLAPAGLLHSFRPADREPPRLATRPQDQEALIVAFLEQPAFDEDTGALGRDALQNLEEWWRPKAASPAP